MLRDASSPPEPRAVVVESTEGFLDLRREWTELLRTSTSDSPFVSWDWLQSWWTHLGANRKLQLLTVRSGGRLIGVAPLSVSRDRLSWLTRLEFLGTGWAGSDYLDVIVERGLESECLQTMSDWLKHQRRALRLDHVSGGSAASVDLTARLSQSGWRARTLPSGTCPFATLHGHSWDSYLGTLAPSHQTRFRRYQGTLKKKFAFGFEAVTSEPQRQMALAALMKFHGQRWTAGGGSTAFQTPPLRAFHDEVTRRALEDGWLRMFVLTLNERPAAVAYCFAHNHRFYLYQHGFDECYRQYSVGLVMLGLAIRAALEEGAREFDMLWGAEPYKFLWTAESRSLTCIEVFPSHIGGRVHHQAVEAERRLRTLARRLFPRKPCNSNVPHAGVAS